MKVTTVVATLFLSTASASPVEARYAPPFAVTDFNAESVPHSVETYYGFNVQVSPEAAFTKCSATAEMYEALTSVPVTACEATGVYFNFTVTGGQGADLDIFYRSTSEGEFKGSHHITQDELPFQGVGTGVHQVYTGPQNFSITNVIQSSPTEKKA